MKSFFSLLLALAAAYNACAQTKKVTVNSSIEHVTVFTQGAQVQRSATASIPAGTAILVFPDISPELEEKSIQVQGQGAFTILSVARDRNYLQPQTQQADIRQLQQQEEGLQEKLQRENNKLKVFTQEEEMLSKNQEIRGTSTGLKTQDLREAMDFQRARLAEVLEQQLTIRRGIKTLSDNIARLQAQQRALMEPKDSSTSNLLITVSAKEAISGKFSLRYLVKNAGWYPNYALRVESISRPLSMEYKANVFQQCGENWKNVKLRLSSGNPSESGQKPELQPWHLRTFSSRQEMLVNRSVLARTGSSEAQGTVTDRNGQPLPGVSVFVPERSIGTVTNENGQFSLQLPPNTRSLEVSYVGFAKQHISVTGRPLRVTMIENQQNLDEVVVVGYGTQQKKVVTGSAIKLRGVTTAAPAPPPASIPLEVSEVYNPTTVSFDIAMPYSIPSDGKAYAVSIREMELPAIYEYHTAPKIDPSAYLLAGLTGWEALNLMEGEASIYYEGAYLGKTLLNLQTATDTLFISLGKDKNIVVNRKLQKDYSRNQFLGSTHTVTHNWEISVKNNKREPVRILVEDQLPISTQKEIEISRTDYAGARLDEASHQVTWDLNIPSREEKKMQLRYAIKYPKDKVVNLN
ncbi:hypothetical protein DLD77_02215 [Chitinophaga alhagiae]|uniref:Mucoidy inhibitor MuiA family protein n=1 Tax=Chitinophaga alhagiae TaxID=2203219 RepID=A0ABN5LSA8_9BACT|nr:DUF4139 domain-containing protein [Chitinophaga alhagiae]AWO00595.1 hypothetical protein DLD77_02215 [Chitinophaga alhagiae]